MKTDLLLTFTHNNLNHHLNKNSWTASYSNLGIGITYSRHVTERLGQCFERFTIQIFLWYKACLCICKKLLYLHASKSQRNWVTWEQKKLGKVKIWHCTFSHFFFHFKGCRMGRSDKVSLWYVSLLINTRFRFFI